MLKEATAQVLAEGPLHEPRHGCAPLRSLGEEARQASIDDTVENRRLRTVALVTTVFAGVGGRCWQAVTLGTLWIIGQRGGMSRSRREKTRHLKP